MKQMMVIDASKFAFDVSLSKFYSSNAEKR